MISLGIRKGAFCRLRSKFIWGESMGKTNSIGSRLIKKWEEKENLILLEGWARDGFTNADIAHKMGVSANTLYELKKASKAVRDALAAGAEVVDYKVENALLKAALGFQKREVKTVTVIKCGVVVEEREEVTEYPQSPNVYAIQSWLYNRRPDKWCKNPEQRITLESDDTVSIVVTRASNDETGTRPGLDDTVNKSVTVRGMTEEEKKAANSKSKKSDDGEIDVDYWPDDWEDD